MAVTLGYLKQNGKLVEIGCTICGYHAYVEPDSLHLLANFEITMLAKVLPCPGCGITNTAVSSPVWARPDARPPRMGGSAEE